MTEGIGSIVLTHSGERWASDMSATRKGFWKISIFFVNQGTNRYCIFLEKQCKIVSTISIWCLENLVEYEMLYEMP